MKSSTTYKKEEKSVHHVPIFSSDQEDMNQSSQKELCFIQLDKCSTRMKIKKKMQQISSFLESRKIYFIIIFEDFLFC